MALGPIYITPVFGHQFREQLTANEKQALVDHVEALIKQGESNVHFDYTLRDGTKGTAKYRAGKGQGPNPHQAALDPATGGGAGVRRTPRTRRAGRVTKGVLPHNELARLVYAASGKPLSRAYVNQLTRALNGAMAEFGIRTPRQIFMFLAQCGHESGGFTHLEERGRPSRYGGYHGGGLMQLTWASNYARAGAALGLDLVRNPNLVRRNLSVAARTAAWFWRRGNGDLNPLAERGWFNTVTQRINGGQNGRRDRRRRLASLYREARSNPIRMA